MARKEKIDYSLVAFYCGIAVVIFMVGGFFGERNIVPYRWLNDGVEAYKALQKQAEVEATRPELLRPIRYPGSGITRYIPQKSAQGLTLIQGNFPAGIQAKMIDMAGNTVRIWPLKIYQVWPQLSHVPRHLRPASEFNYTTQGMLAQPDGSVVIIINHLGLVKYDRCGNQIWTVDVRAHHAITQDTDGSFWLMVKTDTDDIPDAERLPWISQQSLLEHGWKYGDELVHLSADGKIINRVSIMHALLEGQFEHYLRDMAHFKEEQRKLDPTHVNAVVVVTPALAAKLEKNDVKAGDLLISIRQFHTIAILDRATGAIKWHKNGPWVYQHSPIIMPDGNIVVFNNGHKTQGYSRNRIAGSNLIKLYPDTGETEILFPTKEEDAFYSDIQGTVQRLSNGNFLVAESRSGRVFELRDADEQGQQEIVWEYLAPYDDSHASLITGALRYEQGYFTHDGWDCPAL